MHQLKNKTARKLWWIRPVGSLDTAQVRSTAVYIHISIHHTLGQKGGQNVARWQPGRIEKSVGKLLVFFALLVN